MNVSKVFVVLGILLSFISPTFSAENTATSTPAVKGIVVRLHLSADEKIQKDLAYYLKGELELLEGLTLTESKDVPADYELDVQEVDEPLGRMALSISFTLPFNQKDNAFYYHKLLADHWKGGLKDAEWSAYSDYFKPYGITVSRQLLTGRKSKVRDLCTSVSATFSKDVLKRPVQVEATPEK